MNRVRDCRVVLRNPILHIPMSIEKFMEYIVRMCFYCFELKDVHPCADPPTIILLWKSVFSFINSFNDEN